MTRELFTGCRVEEVTSGKTIVASQSARDIVFRSDGNLVKSQSAPPLTLVKLQRWATLPVAHYQVGEVAHERLRLIEVGVAISYFRVTRQRVQS